MGVRRLTEIALGWAALAVVFLGCASTALADDNPYANFTRCPTGAPEMNDPAISGAACVSGLVRDGSLKVGNFQAKLASPLHLQFGFVIKESEEPLVVPGSTSLEMEPFLLPNPFVGVSTSGSTPASPSAPKKARKAKKRHKKAQRCRKHAKKKGQKKQKRCKKRRKKPAKKKPHTQLPPGTSAPPPSGPNLIAATLEPAGDVRKIKLAALFGEPVPLFELPVKVHLEGAGLGPACFIGTDAGPIVLAPLSILPPTEFGLGKDPNGFEVESLNLSGGTMEDASFAVAGASGCGPQGSLDAQINGLFGLPASGGASKAILGNMLLQIAAAANDETPPEPGEELQAAFEAAAQ